MEDLVEAVHFPESDIGKYDQRPLAAKDSEARLNGKDRGAPNRSFLCSQRNVVLAILSDPI